MDQSNVTSREPSSESDHQAEMSREGHGQDQASNSSFLSTTTEADDAEDYQVDGETRRSRVTALRTMFSLRDIGKEACKDYPPKDNNAFDSRGNNRDGSVTPNNFDEERLYMPVPKKLGVYPQSAPASRILPPRSDTHDLAGQLSARDDEGGEHVINTEQKTRKHENATEDDEANEKIDSMIHEEAQAPTARRGQYLNSGHGEIVKTQASIQSLKAEAVSSAPALFLQEIHEEGSDDRPDEISSFITAPSACQHSSSFDAQDAQPNPETQGPHPQQITERDDHLLTGTTSHGGSAPPPPVLGYQNTTSLEQQLFSHVQALHHHMNSVVGRLTKTFENSNSWTMDQVLRNVETMSDTARLMNSRSVSQSENIMKLQRGVVDACGQIDALQVEMRRMEERMMGGFRQEMGRLRRDIDTLILSSRHPYCANVPRVDASGRRPEMQGIPASKQSFLNKGQDIFDKKEDTKFTGDSNVSGEKKAVSSNCVNKNTEKDGIVQVKPAQHPPPSTPVHGGSKTDSAYPQRKGSIALNPARESSGSPEPKSTRDRSPSLDAVSENSQSTLQPLQKQKTDGSSRSEQETAKTPHRRGMFGFRRRRDGDQQSFSSSRFLRTPRRNKDKDRDSNNKIVSDDLKKTASTDAATTAPVPSTPPVPKVPANLVQSAANDESMSPSAVHPALRNPRQQQIMREREQRLHHQQARLQQLNTDCRANQGPSSTSTALVHQRSLRGSRSHQDFRSKSSMTPSSSSFFKRSGAGRSPSFSSRLDSAVRYQGLAPPPAYPSVSARYISASGSFVEAPRLGSPGGLQGRGHGKPLASRPVGHGPQQAPGRGSLE